MLRALLARLRDRIAVEDAADRIEGSGEALLDPAYNGRYTAERELNRLSEAADAGGGSDAADAADTQRDRRR